MDVERDNCHTMGEYEASQEQILNGASGLHDTYFVRQATFWRGTSYSPGQPHVDYALRRQRLSTESNSKPESGLQYLVTGDNDSYSGLALTASKPACCGRKNAGAHLQCWDCPER